MIFCIFQRKKKNKKKLGRDKGKRRVKWKMMKREERENVTSILNTRSNLGDGRHFAQAVAEFYQVPDSPVLAVPVVELVRHAPIVVRKGRSGLQDPKDLLVGIYLVWDVAQGLDGVGGVEVAVWEGERLFKYLFFSNVIIWKEVDGSFCFFFLYGESIRGTQQPAI